MGVFLAFLRFPLRFASGTSSLWLPVPHPITDQHAAILKGPALLEFQVNLSAHRVEKRDPGTEKDGMDVEADLVDQLGLDAPCKHFAAGPTSLWRCRAGTAACIVRDWEWREPGGRLTYTSSRAKEHKKQPKCFSSFSV